MGIYQCLVITKYFRLKVGINMDFKQDKQEPTLLRIVEICRVYSNNSFSFICDEGYYYSYLLLAQFI